ncbi:RES domain-containing protein [Bradyrhizobium japonicum]|nr:RES domain-containing protein [Bradyrhizobium japonicum]
MTPLPGALGGTELVAWRLDQATYAATWDSGEGAFLVGGRWNSRGLRAVYCSVDPATAILEVAVHKGFRALDTIPHVLTAITVDPTSVFAVELESDVCRVRRRRLLQGEVAGVVRPRSSPAPAGQVVAIHRGYTGRRMDSCHAKPGHDPVDSLVQGI